MAISARRNDTIFSRIFDVFNVIFLAAVAAVTILPFIYVLACSFATEKEILEKPFFIIPSEFQFESYKYIFSSATLPRAFVNTVYITIVGTIIALFFNITLAYPLAKQRIMGRNVILSLITFTLVFGGGMIPTFLVIKGLGLIDSLWSLMLPGAISTWNLIIIKNFFQGIPAELEEAAKIDGAGDMRVLWQIVLPLSKPMLATFALFYAVGFWNSYTSALLYINDMDKWTLQIMLRQIIMLANGAIDGSEFDETVARPPSESVQMAVIVFGTLPILCVYPFLQKHFTKGVMVGAIKG
ncbi:MAG TPA: carbohydrate ABC transporter permease [Candidatus Faecimorpha stercoravium]|nr:carbohydrate ABC transporter permease [Candidatus Faecimorpha stercoravium]